MIHHEAATELNIHVGERLSIKNKNNKKIIAVVDIVSKILKTNEIAVSEDILKNLNLKNKEIVEVEIPEFPRSISFIKKKLRGKRLTKYEINEIIKDISNNSISETEIAFFIAAVFIRDLSLDETKSLIESMVNTGEKLNLKGKIVDKHSIGGVAGNRVTPIIVSICASAGLTIPKTSSRAITSASGTADVIETIAKVEFSLEEIKKIVKKTNGCLVWGGALGLAPVDDKIIKVERILNIDSSAQMLASILSKKISVGSKYILIEIPYGDSCKVTKKQAIILKDKFLKLGEKFGLNLEVVLTDGSEPIGNGIGPVLEIKDVLKVLKREDPPKDLEEKSIFLAGKLLELAGKAEKGKGEELAKNILNSGKAFEKFKEIIEAQDGNLKTIPTPKFSYTIKAKMKFKILHINNRFINNLAKSAGCPEDKTAGVYLYKKKGNIVEAKENVLTIYSSSKERLNHAIKFFKKNKNKILKTTHFLK